MKIDFDFDLITEGFEIHEEEDKKYICDWVKKTCTEYFEKITENDPTLSLLERSRNLNDDEYFSLFFILLEDLLVFRKYDVYSISLKVDSYYIDFNIKNNSLILRISCNVKIE